MIYLKGLIFCLFIFISSSSFAITYFWVGGNSVTAKWGASGNWSTQLGGTSSLDSIVYSSNDSFIFDGLNIGFGSGSVTFTLLDSPVIGQLEIRNFINPNFVLLKPNTSSTRTISVNPSLPNSNFFLVDSLSSLFLSGNSSRSLILSIGTNALAKIGGVLQTNFGTTGRGRLTDTLDNIHFTSTSHYVYNQNGGSLPIATWEDGSRCSITGVTTTTPSNIATQSFSNFSWNCPMQNSNASLTTSTSTSFAVRDTFRIVSTGSDTLFVQNNAKAFSGQFGSVRMDAGKLVFHKSTNSNLASFVIDKSLNLFGGYCILDASKGVSNCTLTVKGDLVQFNSRLDFVSASALSNVSFILQGDFLQEGISEVLKTKGSNACQFVFAGQNTSFSSVSNGIKSDLSLVVFKEAILDTLTFNSGFLADSVDFTIKKGLVYFPDGDHLDVVIHTLNVLSDATLMLDGQHTLTIKKDWNNTGTFSTGKSTVVFSSDNEQFINSTLNTESFYSLKMIGSGLKKLSVGTIAAILPSGSLSLDSGVSFDLTSQIVIFKSDSGAEFTDNTAHLAILPESAKILNADHFRMERYIPQGKRTLRFLSAPVKGARVSNWAESFYVTGQKSNYPDNAALPAKIPTVTYYNESLNGNASQKFLEVNGLGSELEIGRGYRAFIRGGRDINLSDPIPFATATTIVAEGTPNIGDITVDLSYTDHSKPAEDGWNLIGNPYPAPIDWENLEGSDRAILNNAFYVFDPRIGKNGGYYSYSKGVSSALRENPSIIPSSQSFFVKMNSPGMAELHFHENQKVTSSHKGNFRQASDNLIRISVSGLDDFDETVIQFNELTTSKFDIEFDAYKLDKSGLSVSSQSLEGTNLSINRLPASDVIYIPLSIKSLANGTYRLDLNSTFLEGNALFLVDHFLKRKIPIEHKVAYGFEVNSTPESSSSKRFTIENTLLSLSSSVSYSDNKNTLQLFPNPLISDELFFFSNTGNVEQLELLDLSGRILFSCSNPFETNVCTIPAEIKNGAYLVKCYSETNVYTRLLHISR